MKTHLKITLLACSAAMAATVSAPVAAGDHFAGLRGMFSPQAAVSEFEGRFAQPQSHDMSWQQRRLQAPTNYAQPATSHASSHASSHNYYAPQRRTESYSRFGSQGSKSKYGNVYDYESGRCGDACAPAPRRVYVPRPAYYAPQPTVSYRQVTQYKCWDGEIVATQDGCKRQTITQTIPQYRCWDGEVVTDVNGCKRQTVTREVTRMVDNTHHSSNAVNCPSGTSKQSDGTCLETSSAPMTSYGSGYSGYQNQSSSSSSFPTNCPSGTSAQSDGTCMEGGSSGYTNDYTSPYSGSSVELFSATPSAPSSYGYNSDDSYGLRGYTPIRK